MKFLFDLFPILLFFAAYAITGDIFTATKTTIAATFFQVIYSLLRHRKVDTMLWISFLLVTVLGGATLIFHNQAFIQWKPTVLYWTFSTILLGTHWLKKVNLIEKLMHAQISLPTDIWTKLMLAWVCFFALMGSLNLIIANYLSLDMWVMFKVFGTLVLTLFFVVLQSLYLSRFAKQDKENGSQI